MTGISSDLWSFRGVPCAPSRSVYVHGRRYDNLGRPGVYRERCGVSTDENDTKYYSTFFRRDVKRIIKHDSSRRDISVINADAIKQSASLAARQPLRRIALSRHYAALQKFTARGEVRDGMCAWKKKIAKYLITRVSLKHLVLLRHSA